MKKCTFFLVLFLFAIGVQAQRTVISDANVQSRKVPGFNGIEVSGGIDLYLSQDDEEALAVSASTSDARDDIRTEVQNGILKIWYKNSGRKWTSGNRKLRAYVAFKNLDQIKASGASDVIITGALKGEQLTIVLSGASDLKGDIQVNKLTIEQSGASDATLSGKVEELVLHTSGASEMDGYALESETCTVKASGASDVMITVNKALHADASGASSVKHRGKASVRDIKTAGGGRVRS
jgi:hypothetical protein